MAATDQIIEVHLHLSNAILSLTEALKNSGSGSRQSLTEIARLLTAAQEELGAVSKALRGEEPVVTRGV